MMVPLVVVLAALPVDLVAVEGEQGVALTTLRTELAGSSQVVDISSLYRYLVLDTGMFDMQDFTHFTAAPIGGWPPELGKEWREGLETCRALAGPPPWKSPATAWGCSHRLSTYLLGRLAHHHHARAIYVVRVSPPGAPPTVFGEVFGPDDETETTRIADLPTTGRADVIRALTRALITREGTAKARTVVNVLAQKPAIDVFTGSAELGEALPLKGCDRAPSALVVTPDSVLARTLVRRWAASNGKGTSPPATCTLELSLHIEDTFGTKLDVANAVLSCGGVSASSQLARTKQEIAKHSERLLTRVTERFCN